MTLKVVKNSVDSNLQVLAAEGRDVSGFEPLYNRLNKQVSEIDKRIGIDPYSSQRAKIPKGEILIERDGKIGSIPPGEFNSKTDKKL